MALKGLHSQQKKGPLAARKAETRTKIQLGGLILKADLAATLGIETGDDLQLDLTKRDATEILLGALIDIKNQLDQDPARAKAWKALGQTWFAKDA